jgi:SHS2 domain-containing protein
MNAYMIEDYEGNISYDQGCSVEFTISAHDVLSLLYKYMQECLYRFHVDELAVGRVIIQSINLADYSLTARIEGEKFNLTKHKPGTEIKAITYSNMQVNINNNPQQQQHNNNTTQHAVEIYVIVDI